MASIYRLKDTFINLADIDMFSLAAIGSDEDDLKSIAIDLRRGSRIKIDFKDREEAEWYCEKLEEAWQEYLFSLPGTNEKLLKAMANARNPTGRFDEIFCEDEEVQLSLNPFTQFIIDALYEDKQLKEKSLAALEKYREYGHAGVVADPAQLLNFDFALYPDHLYMMLPQDKVKLDGYYEFCCVKRIGDNLYFELQVCNERNKDTSVLNPKLLLAKMMEAGYGTALTCYDDFTYFDEDVLIVNFYYSHVGGGNMYKAYLDAFAVLETIYHKALKELKEEARPLV